MHRSNYRNVSKQLEQELKAFMIKKQHLTFFERENRSTKQKFRSETEKVHKTSKLISF